QPLLALGSSRRYLCESVLGCLVPYHGGITECVCLFLPLCHRPSPTEAVGRLARIYPRTRFSAERFSRRETFFSVQASEFARLPDRSYRCAYCRRAAETFTSEQSMLRYLTCIGYASRPNRQLAARGLSPRKIRSLVGCSPLSTLRATPHDVARKT